jgi:hypothetical protein
MTVLMKSANALASPASQFRDSANSDTSTDLKLRICPQCRPNSGIFPSAIPHDGGSSPILLRVCNKFPPSLSNDSQEYPDRRASSHRLGTHGRGDPIQEISLGIPDPPGRYRLLKERFQP